MATKYHLILFNVLLETIPAISKTRIIVVATNASVKPNTIRFTLIHLS